MPIPTRRPCIEPIIRFLNFLETLLQIFRTFLPSNRRQRPQSLAIYPVYRVVSSPFFPAALTNLVLIPSTVERSHSTRHELQFPSKPRLAKRLCSILFSRVKSQDASPLTTPQYPVETFGGYGIWFAVGSRRRRRSIQPKASAARPFKERALPLVDNVSVAPSSFPPLDKCYSASSLFAA